MNECFKWIVQIDLPTLDMYNDHQFYGWENWFREVSRLECTSSKCKEQESGSHQSDVKLHMLSSTLPASLQPPWQRLATFCTEILVLPEVSWTALIDNTIVLSPWHWSSTALKTSPMASYDSQNTLHFTGAKLKPGEVKKIAQGHMAIKVGAVKTQTLLLIACF